MWTAPPERSEGGEVSGAEAGGRATTGGRPAPGLARARRRGRPVGGWRSAPAEAGKPAPHRPAERRLRRRAWSTKTKPLRRLAGTAGSSPQEPAGSPLGEAPGRANESGKGAKRLPLSIVSMNPTKSHLSRKKESNREATTMTSPKVVLRFERSTLARLNAMTAHEQRTGGDLRHIDAARTAENRVLVGSGDPGADVRERIAEMADANLSEEVAALKAKSQHKAARERLRAGPKDPWDPKQTRPLTRGVLSASPEWFTSPERVELFAERSQKWLEETFGESLVAASLHLDEKTPHIHFELLPTVEKTSARRGRQLAVNHRQHPAFAELHDGRSSYERLQDDAGELFADVGLERGARRAEFQRTADAFGLPPVAPLIHQPPAEWRAERRAAATVAGAEAQASGILAAADVEAQTTIGTARSSAQRTRAEAEAYGVGVRRGIEAIMADEIAWRPPAQEKPAGLRPGSAWPKDEAARRSLVDTIRPAMTWLTGFAERVAGYRAAWKAQEARGAALDAREAAVAGRELAADARAVSASEKLHEADRRVKVADAALRAAGRPQEAQELRRQAGGRRLPDQEAGR